MRSIKFVSDKPSKHTMLVRGIGNRKYVYVYWADEPDTVFWQLHEHWRDRKMLKRSFHDAVRLIMSQAEEDGIKWKPQIKV